MNPIFYSVTLNVVMKFVKEQTGTNNDEIGNICGFQNVNRDT